jgi:predicted dehydrogenase
MIDGKLGVAIHGVGQVAVAHAASWRKNPHVKIVSVGSRRRDSAQRLVDSLGLDCRVHDTLEQALADPEVDIVNLSGPNFVHTPQGIAAAKAGKHILMEKPMCHTMEENRALCDAVAAGGVRSVVSFVLRWNPLFENLKSLLAGGAVGKLFYVEVDYWHGLGPHWTGHEWARSRSGGGSTMLLGGCHAVDAIRWFSGRKVVEVTAYANDLRGNWEFPANVVAILKFDDGTIGKTSALFDAELPYAFNIDLVGTEGTLRDNRLDHDANDPARLGRRRASSVRRGSEPPGRLHPRGPRVALQHRRRLPYPRGLHRDRPVDRARRAAGVAAAGIGPDA